METPQKIGISATIIIILMLFFILHYQDEYREIVLWIIGIAFTLLIPFIYDYIQQRRKRKNIRAFIEVGLEDIKVIKEHLKNIEGIEKIKRIEKTIRQNIEEFHNIIPYIQDAYNEETYTTYNTKIEYLRAYKINKGLDNYKINEVFNNYYNLVLVEIDEIKKMLSFS